MRDKASYFRQLNKESPPDNLLCQIIEANRKDSLKEVPDELYLEDKDRELILKLYELEQTVLTVLKNGSDFRFGFELREKRLWLLDESGRKLMSGFIDVLLVDSLKKTGVIFKRHLDSKPPVSTQEDNELRFLALIASEALKLQKVLVITLWVSDQSVTSMCWYTSEMLSTLSNNLKSLLKQLSNL
jgi:hypothetical protein